MTAPRPGVLLLVDLSYQTYRAAAAHPLLRSLTGDYTGGLYGFFVTVSSIAARVGATKVVVCADAPPYVRSKVYPEYKQLRASTSDPELRERVAISKVQIAEVLQGTPIPVVSVPGFEADDVIAHFVRLYRRRYEHIYAASNDSDLYQLLVHSNFSVYRKSLDDTMTATRLLSETKLTPKQFALASAIMGTHNEVAGVHGVGIVKARDMVLDPAKLRKIMSTHREMIERNQELIALPHRDFPRELRAPAGPATDVRGFYRALAKYDVNATHNMVWMLENIRP